MQSKKSFYGYTEGEINVEIKLGSKGSRFRIHFSNTSKPPRNLSPIVKSAHKNSTSHFVRMY